MLDKKHQRSKLESAYCDKPQMARLGTKYTITTPNGNIIHRKNISKPITDFVQKNSNRGNGPRGPDGRFTKSPSKPKWMPIIETERDPDAPSMETESPKTPKLSDNATFKKRTFERGRPKLIRERTRPDSPQNVPDKIPALDDNTVLLKMSTDHMTETEIHQAIQDAKCADQEFFIRDENGKVFTDPNIIPITTENNLETSEFELASNLSSSTEIETDIKTEEKTIRRSKRLTKTNPIVSYNNPFDMIP